jgi:transcriptional regulator NrdR family protein
MSQSYRVEQDDGSMVEFSRDQLFLSIHEALAHRKDIQPSASILTETIISTLQSQHRLLIKRSALVEIAAEVIKRFDRTAYVRYISMHQPS